MNNTVKHCALSLKTVFEIPKGFIHSVEIKLRTTYAWWHISSRQLWTIPLGAPHRQKMVVTQLCLMEGSGEFYLRKFEQTLDWSRRIRVICRQLVHPLTVVTRLQVLEDILADIGPPISINYHSSRHALIPMSNRTMHKLHHDLPVGLGTTAMNFFPSLQKNRPCQTTNFNARRRSLLLSFSSPDSIRPVHRNW